MAALSSQASGLPWTCWCRTGNPGGWPARRRAGRCLPARRACPADRPLRMRSPRAAGPFRIAVDAGGTGSAIGRTRATNARRPSAARRQRATEASSTGVAPRGRLATDWPAAAGNNAAAIGGRRQVRPPAEGSRHASGMYGAPPRLAGRASRRSRRDSVFGTACWRRGISL